MSDLAGRRAELVTAMTTAGLRVTKDPAGLAGSAPAAIVYGDGVSGMEHVGRGQVVAGFRILLVSGAWDGASASDVLAGLVSTLLNALRTLVGWSVGEVGPDSAVTIGTNRLLGADVRTSVMIDV